MVVSALFTQLFRTWLYLDRFLGSSSLSNQFAMWSNFKAYFLPPFRHHTDTGVQLSQEQSTQQAADHRRLLNHLSLQYGIVLTRLRFAIAQVPMHNEYLIKRGEVCVSYVTC